MNTDTLFQTAITLHQGGKLEEAAAAYRQALQATSQPSATLLYFAGLAYGGLGQPAKAQTLLRQAVALSPRGDYMLAHGNALATLGRHKAAIAVLRDATALDPNSAALWFNLGNSCMAASKPREAAEAFARALEIDPLITQALANLAAALLEHQDYPGFAALLGRVYGIGLWRSHIADIALMGIGSIAKAAKREVAAQPMLEALLALVSAHPDDARLCWAMGSLCMTLRDFTGAEASFEAAVRLSPDQVGAIRALALILAMRGEDGRARELLGNIRDEDPQAAEIIKIAGYFVTVAEMSAAAIRVFGTLEQVYGLTDEIFDNHFSWLLLSRDADTLPDAVALLERRLETHLTPDNYVNLGVTYQKMKDNVEAVRYFRLALTLDAKNFFAWYNLAGTLLHINDVAGSYEAAGKAFKMRPDLVDGAINFSLAASKLGFPDEAEKVLKRGLKHNPDSPELLNLLGNLKMQRGNMRLALKYFEQARSVAEARNDPALFQMQLMSVNYSMDVPPETTAEMHFRWGNAMAAAHADSTRRALPPSLLKERLRVGYMSGDYRNHSCSFFAGPLLSAHDPEKIEVFCYMTELGGDEITNRFRREAPHWREIKHLTDNAAADLIREDGIDILVDLSGHTSGARLELLAIKPAPIQVNWLGYPNTTGLPTVDYRITDALADPVGMTDHLHSETLYRLPNFLCYRPARVHAGGRRAAGAAQRPRHFRLLQQLQQDHGRGCGDLVADHAGRAGQPYLPQDFEPVGPADAGGVPEEIPQERHRCFAGRVLPILPQQVRPPDDLWRGRPGARSVPLQWYHHHLRGVVDGRADGGA